VPRLVATRRCSRLASVVAAVLLLALSGVVHAAQLTLSWSDASTNEDGFKIERATGTAGAYGLLASVSAGTTGYVDGAVTAGTTIATGFEPIILPGTRRTRMRPAPRRPARLCTRSRSARPEPGAGRSPRAERHRLRSACSASIAGGTSLALSATSAAGSTFSG